MALIKGVIKVTVTSQVTVTFADGCFGWVPKLQDNCEQLSCKCIPMQRRGSCGIIYDSEKAIRAPLPPCYAVEVNIASILAFGVILGWI